MAKQKDEQATADPFEDYSKAAPPEQRPLTPKQQAMVYEYVRTGGDCLAAYTSAYPDSRRTKTNAQIRDWVEKALKSPRFANELRILQAKIENERAQRSEAEGRLVADVVDVMESAARALKVDPASIHDEFGHLLPVAKWPADTRLAVDGIEYDKDTGLLKSVKFSPRAVARDQLAKHLGWYEKDNRQKHPHKGLSNEELDAKLQEAIRLARIESPHIDLPEPLAPPAPTPEAPTQH